MPPADDNDTNQGPVPIGECDLRRCASTAQETVLHPGRPETWTQLCSFHADEATQVTTPAESAESTEPPHGTSR